MEWKILTLYAQKDTTTRVAVKILLRLPVDTRRGRDEEERSRPTITRLDGVCRRNDDPLRLVLRP